MVATRPKFQIPALTSHCLCGKEVSIGGGKLVKNPSVLYKGLRFCSSCAEKKGVLKRRREHHERLRARPGNWTCSSCGKGISDISKGMYLNRGIQPPLCLACYVRALPRCSSCGDTIHDAAKGMYLRTKPLCLSCYGKSERVGTPMTIEVLA